MLTVFHGSNDYSKKFEDYLSDSVSLILLDSESIDIGFHKPINAMYLELNAFNANTSLVSVQYYNGAFTDLVIEEETDGLKRSGFIKWERNQANEVKTTLHSKEMYWYKLKVDSDTSSIEYSGINLVFSNDINLTEEYPNILDFLPENKSSFIGFHQAARNDIVTKLRNQGNKIQGLEQKKLDQFDLLDFEEMKDASKFLVLSKIFFWISDAVGDKWHEKAVKFESKYGDKIDLYFLSIDKNDDGIKDANETQSVNFARIDRV
jgi:hypothetical protein